MDVFNDGRAVMPLVSVVRYIGLAGVLALFAVEPDMAFAEAGGLAIELNKTADNGGDCQMTYVITNSTGSEISTASYEMAVYDKEGHPALFALNFGTIVPGTPQVIQFDVPKTSCADISKITVNDPKTSCAADPTNKALCDAKPAAWTSSNNAGIPFN